MCFRDQFSIFLNKVEKLKGYNKNAEVAHHFILHCPDILPQNKV